MASRVIIEAAQPSLDHNGNLISGAKLQFFDADTLEPKAVYSDNTLSISLGSEITSDGYGMFPDMWAANNSTFRVVWKDSDDVVLKTFNRIVVNSGLEGVSDFGAELVQSSDYDTAKTILNIKTRVLYLSEFAELGSASLNTIALQNAIIAVSTIGNQHYGKDIVINYNGDFYLNPITISSLTGGIRPFKIKFGGFNALVKPAQACNTLIEFQCNQISVEDLIIADSDLLIADSAIKLTANHGETDWPSYFNNIALIQGNGSNFGTAVLFRNNGAGNINANRLFALNCRGVLAINRGGVNTVWRNIYSLGTLEDIFVDFDAVTGSHCENLTVENATLQPTRAGGVGINLAEGLHLKFKNVTSVQHGAGGSGLKITPAVGKSVVFVEFEGCYFEGTANITNNGVGGAAIFMRGGGVSYGTVQEISFDNCGIGSGAYSEAYINCIDADNINTLKISKLNAFFPNANCNRIWSITNSSNIHINSDCIGMTRANNLPVDTNSSGTVYLTSGAIPASANRATGMKYPNGAWKQLTITPTASSGTLTSATALINYIKDGRKITATVKLTFTNIGTGAGVINISLPSYLRARASALHMAGLVRENANTGSTAYQAYIVDATLVLMTSAQGFPATNGSEFYFTINYEAYGDE